MGGHAIKTRGTSPSASLKSIGRKNIEEAAWYFQSQSWELLEWCQCHFRFIGTDFDQGLPLEPKDLDRRSFPLGRDVALKIEQITDGHGNVDVADLGVEESRYGVEMYRLIQAGVRLYANGAGWTWRNAFWAEIL
jgi:hypothetical protein